jgi:hypothetical protein
MSSVVDLFISSFRVGVFFASSSSDGFDFSTFIFFSPSRCEVAKARTYATVRAHAIAESLLAGRVRFASVLLLEFLGLPDQRLDLVRSATREKELGDRWRERHSEPERFVRDGLPASPIASTTVFHARHCSDARNRVNLIIWPVNQSLT